MKVKGNGAVRQVKNKKGESVKNSWQLVLSLGYDPLTGKRRQQCRHFKGTKTQARRALEEFRREVESGLKLDGDKVTFGEYSQQWIESREASGRLAPATIKRNKEVLRHLSNYLETVSLKDIDAPTIRNLYVKMASYGLGHSTLVQIGITLKQVLRQAVADDILLRNPCDQVESPKQQKSTASKTLDKKGVTRLIGALNEVEQTKYPHAQLAQQKATANMSHVIAVRLILATGLRHGEVLGLSWNSIDLDNARLDVDKTLDRVTGKLKNPKTDSGNRAISLDAQIVTDLKRWKRVQARYLLSLGISQDATTPVVSNEAGGQMDGNNSSRWWRSFRERYGFDGLRLHDLRHTHATMLVSSGLNIKAVSSRLGHASVGITLDLYAHAQREDDEKAAAIIGKIMNNPTAPMGKVINL